MALGARIRHYRIKAKLTLEQLSDLSKVEVGTINALENRDSKRSQYASAIAAALGLTVEMIEDGTKDYDVLTFSSEELAEREWARVEKKGNPSSQASEPDDDEVRIRQYDTGGKMGSSGLVLRDQPGVIREWSVNSEWLRHNVHRITSAANLAIVTGFGDSMKPLFNSGDPLLVDTGRRRADVDGIYFFRVGDEGFIKRLQRIPTAKGVVLRAKSENTHYDPFDITQDMDFEVLGWVVKVWRGEDF